MIRLEPRESRPVALVLGAPLGAILLSLALAGILLLWAQAPVFSAFGLLFEGAFGSRRAVTETLLRATPLILTGLAATVAFRARLWNIGAEGQLYMGALAAVIVGSGTIKGPPFVMIPLLILAGAAAGAALMLAPTLLKLKLQVDEVVTTLLLNFVVLLFVQMMIEGPLQDPMGMGWPRSEPIIASARLPQLLEKTRLHWGLVMGLAASGLAWVLINRTAFGFKVRAVGANPDAAGFCGIDVTRVMIMTGLISGALAGLCGVSEVAGTKGDLTQNLSPGFGYTGIVVAMLAQLNALAVVAAAVFVAGVFVGADAMSRVLAISNYIADLIVAMSLMAMLLASLFVRYRVRLR